MDAEAGGASYFDNVRYLIGVGGQLEEYTDAKWRHLSTCPA
jgi:hypothetical protein